MRSPPLSSAGPEEIVYTNIVTGVHANFLRSSIISAGLDPDNLPVADKSKMDFKKDGDIDARAWRDIWGAGQSVAGVVRRESTEEIVSQLEAGMTQAISRLCQASVP